MTLNLVEQDKQHRQLALDASQSFIVQAPAGSGKTELLIQRFLTLLATVEAPEEILAITFTKKAASEMRQRVIKALKQALLEPQPLSSHGKQTWLLAKNVLRRDSEYQWHLIDNPNQLRIQTIDSLCSHLTNQLPLLSHFGSEPDICNHPKTLYSEAVQEILMHVEEDYEWSKDLAKLLLHLDNDLNKLQDLLVGLLSKRDQWLPYIQLNSNDADIKLRLENQLSLVIEDVLSGIKPLFPQDLVEEIMAIARFSASHVQSDSPIRTCENLLELPETQAENKKTYLGLATLLLTKSFSWRKQLNEEIGFPALKTFKNPEEIALHKEYRQRFTTLLTTLIDHEDLRITLSELFYLPDPVYNDNQWEILQSLLHVLKIAAAQLRVIFQQTGQIDFIENTQGALIALGNDYNPTDLALALDYHIRHILIDEFQDTSHTQYQLLEKLTQGWEKNDGRTLFIVGDPMQSIYRFREAEVGLFIRMRNRGIHHIKLIPLTLAVNFRSTSTIVEWNNTYFNQLFPRFNDIAMGAVSHSKSVAHSIEDVVNDKTITVSGFVNASNDDEANHIVELIHSTKNNHPDDKIAILVRSRSHLAAIIPALKKAKIAYRAIDIDPLASRQIIQDLLSLTCALLHPADRISWLAILRAPWCGLSLADLFVVANNDAKAAIFTQLSSSEIRNQLSDDGRKRLAKLLPILNEKMAARNRYHLRSWVESTWLLLGGPAFLNDYADIEDVNAYFDLLNTFSDNHLIFNLDKLKERMNQLYASTQHDDATVHIMTIHTAKGLEFDTVILPQLERKNPSDDKSLLLWMEQPVSNDEMALLLTPIHATGSDNDLLYEYIHRQQRRKAAYETDRLLYVATTRAKKRLHLTFNISRNEEGKCRVESGSFLSRIWPLLENQQDDILVEANDSVDTDKNVHSQRYIHRVTSNWVNPVKAFQSQQITPHKQQTGFQRKDNIPTLIGTVTHRILQMLAEHKVSWWVNQTNGDQRQYINTLLKQSGMSIDKREYASPIVMQAINHTLTDERGRWILADHREAKSEYAVTAIIDNKLENLMVDRTFVDENNTLWIIDYKTAAPSDMDKNDFLLHEQKKYAAQMHKYHQALSGQHDRPVRLGLFFPAIPAWCEWE